MESKNIFLRGDSQVESGSEIEIEGGELGSIRLPRLKAFRFGNKPLATSPTHLPSPATPSLQAETEPTDDLSYAPLSDSTNGSLREALYQLLNQVGITAQDIQRLGIEEDLLKIFAQETQRFSALKWSRLDHVVEKTLQWALLKPKDVGEALPEAWHSRVWPAERSILINKLSGLRKAYAARGFAKGFENSLVKAVHYFIYAMLSYRLVEWTAHGSSQFDEFRDLFTGSDQKGIDSLVRSLAKLDATWLELILATPLIVGVMQSAISLLGARKVTPEALQTIEKKITDYLAKSSGFFRDVFLEIIPGLSEFTSASAKAQKLERFVRWDGRLTPQERQHAFSLIRRVAKEGRKIAQLTAMESLAKITQGIGLKDFKRMHEAGYSKADLEQVLVTKAQALSDLEMITQPLDESASRYK